MSTVRTVSTETAAAARTAGAVRTIRTGPARLARVLCAAYARWLAATSRRALTASRSSRWGYLGMVATGQVSNEDRLPA